MASSPASSIILPLVVTMLLLQQPRLGPKVWMAMGPGACIQPFVVFALQQLPAVPNKLPDWWWLTCAILSGGASLIKGDYHEIVRQSNGMSWIVMEQTAKLMAGEYITQVSCYTGFFREKAHQIYGLQFATNAKRKLPSAYKLPSHYATATCRGIPAIIAYLANSELGLCPVCDPPRTVFCSNDFSYQAPPGQKLISFCFSTSDVAEQPFHVQWGPID